jgi:radical SAM protein with 4Fe4S-binding SPASM domain
MRFTHLQAALHRLLSAVRLPPSAIPTGLFHYLRAGQGERARIHLRIDPDGSGILLINASRVLHLNPTAAAMAYLVLEETPESEAVRALTHRYRVSPAQAKSDYAQVRADIQQLIRPDGACPLHDLNLEVTLPFSARPSAPYRMDLALTYRCNNDCAHCYNLRPTPSAPIPTHSSSELTTDQWKRILDRLWEIGIPHVVFTGGEPTLRSDLPELIAHAERNGQISGLNTNGRRLSDPPFVEQLIEAGLDHVQITVESHDAAMHDSMVCAKGAWRQTIAGVQNVLDTPLYVMTNTTMLRQNSPFLGETLDFLASLGVPTIGLNSLIYAGRGQTVGAGLSESELTPLLDLARQKTAEHSQQLIWYTPTQYCHFDPMQLELGIKGCTAALYTMCIEPDGRVIPCQSYYRQIGNILTDPWEEIWNHKLSVSLRERRYVLEKCRGCALLAECGGGCPLMSEANVRHVNDSRIKGQPHDHDS